MEEQQGRHRERMSILNTIHGYLPPQLSSQDIATCLTNFEKLKAAEDKANDDSYESLKAALCKLMEEAEEVREGLRSELHRYGALAKEGSLKEHSEVLQELMRSSPDLDAFFRMSGGTHLFIQPFSHSVMNSLTRLLAYLLICLLTRSRTLTKVSKRN